MNQLFSWFLKDSVILDDSLTHTFYDKYDSFYVFTLYDSL